MNALVVFSYGLRTGWADFRGFWTWQSWLGGWLVRIVAQAAFFALVGRLLDNPEYLRYLVIGNGVVVGALAVNWAVPASTWDRGDGTYPLLVVAPSSLFPAVMGRTAIWLCNGVATSFASLIVLVAAFRIAVDVRAVLLLLPLLVLSCAGVYCFALLLGALVTRAPRTRNIVHNSALTMLMAFAGVSVPVAFWPAPVEAWANVLPLTHGLAAIRLAFDGGAFTAITREAAFEVAVATGWLALSLLTIDRMAEAGRADGTIEFVG